MNMQPIPPANPMGYPTPFWFIELFKVLGFALHMVPMHMWYAGTIIAVLLGFFGRGHVKEVGNHIARALPFALAFGINFGVIPLLFIQVAYYQFFYPATILMAWPWFMVFWMVMVAYFAVYLYRLALYNKFPKKLGKASGWLAAGIFIVVGFIFANALSLMTNVGGWWTIFKGANVGGAATGLAANTSDPTLIPRWLMMFGLAITTTAAYVLVDAAYLSGKDGRDYRATAGKTAFALYSLGMLWFVGFGSWYIFGTRMDALKDAMQNPFMRVLFPLTAVSVGLPWILVFLQRREPTRKLAALAGISQFGVISINAISRQWLQNKELAQHADLASRPVDLQLWPLILFLLLFVAGIVLIWWMLARVVEANKRQAMSNEL